MIKTKYLPVTNKTYINYVNHNRTDRVSKFLKIYTFEKFNETFVLESFDKLYKNTKFEIKAKVFDKKLTNYKSNIGYQILFKTDSENEYRIDLIPIKNFNIYIKSDFVWSISFTLNRYGVGHVYYEELTGLNEEKEVLIRIGDILNKIDIIKYFVIGNTILEKKIRIYKQFLLLVFPDYNIEMSYCEGFIDDKGLYIWK
jgi:hypothetical protein